MSTAAASRRRSSHPTRRPTRVRSTAPGHESAPPRHAIANAEVARLFRELADLLEIEGANVFRVRAYRNAARTIEELPESVAAMVAGDGKRLTELPGIGADLAGKIEEIVRTGHLAALGRAEREAPPGAAELMRVPGIGPKRARAIAEALHVRSLAGLARAAREGRLHALPGLGERLEERILHEVTARASEEHRVLRPTAAQYAEALLAYLRAVPGVTRAEVAGSFRRCRETVGDLDMLVSAEPRSPVSERFVAYSEAAEVLANGHTRSSVRLRSGLQVDLRVLGAPSFGAALHYFTGSKAHNIAVRELGRERGLKINEYGIFRGGRRIGGAEEPEVFAAVGLPWIPPELRENRGEIDAAREGRLPHLVELRDLRGDLQVHSTDSDGRDTLEAMAEAAEAMGYEYIAVTDHTPAVRVAGGLDRAGFRRQRRRIDRLNARLRRLTILAGAEVDIHADGSLDLDDDTLRALDVVVVSLHAKLDLPTREQMARLTRALSHPSVDILGHPTGRLIGSRRGAALDLAALCGVAVDHGVMLAVNAQPERLDLDDVACRAAAEHGVTLVVDTDAHAVAELRAMRWGVDQARRGWVEKRQVANTRPLRELRRLLHGGRR